MVTYLTSFLFFLKFNCIIYLIVHSIFIVAHQLAVAPKNQVRLAQSMYHSLFNKHNNQIYSFQKSVGKNELVRSCWFASCIPPTPDDYFQSISTCSTVPFVFLWLWCASQTPFPTHRTELPMGASATHNCIQFHSIHLIRERMKNILESRRGNWDFGCTCTSHPWSVLSYTVECSISEHLDKKDYCGPTWHHHDCHSQSMH